MLYKNYHSVLNQRKFMYIYKIDATKNTLIFFIQSQINLPLNLNIPYTKNMH